MSKEFKLVSNVSSRQERSPSSRPSPREDLRQENLPQNHNRRSFLKIFSLGAISAVAAAYETKVILDIVEERKKRPEINPKEPVQLIDAPRIDFLKELSPAIMETHDAKGEKIQFAAFKYQGHYIEASAAVNFMEMENEARRFGINLNLIKAHGAEVRNLDFEGEKSLKWLQENAVLFGFAINAFGPNKDQISLLFDPVRASKQFLDLPDDQKPMYQSGCVKGFIEKLKYEQATLSIPRENLEISNYFQTAGLVQGFVPTNFEANNPKERLIYSYQPEKAVKLMTIVSDYYAQGITVKESEGTLWQTLKSTYPYLPDPQLNTLLNACVEVNKLLDPNFNPNKLRPEAHLFILRIPGGEFDQIFSKLAPDAPAPRTPTPPPTPPEVTVQGLKKYQLTPENGVEVIKRFEALRLEKYFCSANVPTIGWGCTRAEIVNKGSITEAVADRELDRDLAKHLREVQRCLGSKIQFLKPDQVGALVSFDFNTGAFANSSALQELKSGNFNIGPNLCLFNKVTDPNTKQKVFASGLFRRRLSEMLCYEGAGSNSYVCDRTYNSWCKELGYNPRRITREQENSFMNKMITLARQERLPDNQRQLFTSK